MKKYFVRISKTEIWLFIGFIKKEDTFVSLLDKFLEGNIKMYKCFKQ